MKFKLLDGRTVDAEAISFDSDTYHFFFGTEDVTENILPKFKYNLVPNFDGALENIRYSRERGVGTGPGSAGPLPTDTGEIFVDQIINEPFDAPIQALGNTVNRALATPGIRAFLIIGAVGVVAYLALKNR